MTTTRILLTLLLISGNAMAQEKSETFRNPVDGKSYVAPGGWNTYQPAQGVAPKSGKVSVVGVRLLNAQKDFEERASVAALAAYLKEVEKIAVAVFSAAPGKAAVMVQFNSRPDRTELKIAHQGDIPQELLQKFYDLGTQVKPPKVSHGELSYQVEYAISP